MLSKKYPFRRAIIAVFPAIFMQFTNSYSRQKIEYREFDLNNGLHVIMHKDTSNPLVTVNIWYHVGSKDEEPNRTGFAHLFEHMMFQGSQNVGKTEHFTYIQKAGGTLNGSTNQDRTNYFEMVPSNQLELVLCLESDRMGRLDVTQENFDKQRDVVKEEKRMRYDNVPYGSRFENLFGREFNDHPYHWITIGSMKDLNDADLDYARNFYRRFYAPNNAVIVVLGDISYSETEKLIEKYFSGLSPSKPKNTYYPDIVFDQGEKRDTIYDSVRLPAVYIGYKIPPVTSRDIYPLSLLSLILGEGKSSRLYQSLVYNNQAARDVRSIVWDLELGGLFLISATGLKDSNPRNIEDLVNDAISRIKEERITDYELEKAKNNIEAEYVNRMQTMLWKSEMLARYWTLHKNADMINTDLENYLGVTPEDINKTANRYLNSDNRVVLHYVPVNSGVLKEKHNLEPVEDQ